MKNILFIQPYASQVGGVDTVLLQLIQGLDRTRYQSYVLLSSTSAYVEKYEALGAKVLFGPLAVFGKPTDLGYYLRNCILLFRSFFYIKKLVKALQIDLIHSHKMEVIGGNLVAKWLGIPAIQTVHELPRKPLIAYKWIAWIDHLLNDRIIVLCDRSKIMFRWFNKESVKLTKIYNGISIKPMEVMHDPMSLKRQLTLAPQHKILITVARLSPMKGLEYLIEAAALIKAEHPDFKFVIVGDVAFEHEKPYKAELLQRVEALGLSDTVFMLGLRRDVPELLSQSDILVLPSVYDIFPTVILEAMQAGLPVIATDVGGVPEMVRQDTGMIIPPQDARALKNAIVTLGFMDYKTLGDNGQKLFRTEFTQKQYVDQTTAIYEALFAAKNKVYVEHA